MLADGVTGHISKMAVFEKTTGEVTAATAAPGSAPCGAPVLDQRLARSGGVGEETKAHASLPQRGPGEEGWA